MQTSLLDHGVLQLALQLHDLRGGGVTLGPRTLGVLLFVPDLFGQPRILGDGIVQSLLHLLEPRSCGVTVASRLPGIARFAPGDETSACGQRRDEDNNENRNNRTDHAKPSISDDFGHRPFRGEAGQGDADDRPELGRRSVAEHATGHRQAPRDTDPPRPTDAAKPQHADHSSTGIP
ncbi:hypothetical protein [Nocardia wallacei]|uniref:hypothetical protein n=1 Tax=Nocardia wallacei TaxID=480035 RepID=UPI00245851E9|nr:hypothetical protein [Nocardia wallacei]